MEKTCFDCGMKDEGWTGPVFSSAEKLRDFYHELGVSDSIVEKMQDGDLLCSKCSGKAECRHALKFYEYYKEKWAPEQYEIWAKNNEKLISIAENELKENQVTNPEDSIGVKVSNIPQEIMTGTEKLAIIEGNPNNHGRPDSTGTAIIDSELAKKFELFCAGHKGKIIDWNTSQDNSGSWFIFIRYVE